MHDRNPSAAAVEGDVAAIRAPEAVPATGQVEYFHAPHHYRPSPAPGFVLGVLGLGLIFLGGCFMIGLLAVFSNNSMPWSGPGIYFYVGTLYLFAFLCFAAAGVMLRLAVRSVMKAERGGDVGQGMGGRNIEDRTSNAQPRSPEAEAGAAFGAEVGTPKEAEAAVEAEQVELDHAVERHRPGVLPGLVLGGLGLGLILPAGCFTFGYVMLNLNTEVAWHGPGPWILLAAIASLAALCYAGAAVMLGLAARALLRAARG